MQTTDELFPVTVGNPPVTLQWYGINSNRDLSQNRDCPIMCDAQMGVYINEMQHDGGSYCNTMIRYSSYMFTVGSSLGTAR